jgi:hypothetical protein
MVYCNTSKDNLGHIPTINEDPTAPPSFLDEGQKALHVWLMDLPIKSLTD